MDIKKQLLIDKFIAKPIAFLLNFLVRIVGKILSIDHSLDKDFKTIVVCKFKGMGSIIQSTPMLSAIRDKYPNAQIIFVSSNSNRKILEKISLIDTIITVDESNLLKFASTNIKSLITLIKIRPELYIDLEIYSNYSTLFTLFSLSTNRIGFYLRSSSYKMGIYTHMMFFNPRVPISNVYLQIAQLIGCETEKSTLYPLEKTIENNPSYSKAEYIVINPNASDLRLERKWGRTNFINLIKKILEDFPTLDILLIGSKGEQDYTEEIASAINHPKVKNTAGLTSVDELIALIHKSKLMISNDTGPMHIAFCTKTPIICLFGPCSPDQYGMNGGTTHIIYKNVYCSPCVHDFEVSPCKGENICMKLITVDEVYSKFQQVINTSIPSTFKATNFIYKTSYTVLGKVIR